MKFNKWLESWEKPDDRTLMIHKETSFSILSGLITQAPLVFFSNWFMLDVMKETGKSIFYLDADVYLKESIEGLFPKLQECDFMIRSKPHDLDNPEKDFRCNAGMVWVKNTEQNIN